MTSRQQQDLALSDDKNPLREIERRALAEMASADLAGVSTVRLAMLALFAVIMLGARTLFGDAAPALDEILRLLAILAGASAVFHVATWAALRLYVKLRNH